MGKLAERFARIDNIVLAEITNEPISLEEVLKRIRRHTEFKWHYRKVADSFRRLDNGGAIHRYYNDRIWPSTWFAYRRQDE